MARKIDKKSWTEDRQELKKLQQVAMGCSKRIEIDEAYIQQWIQTRWKRREGERRMSVILGESKVLYEKWILDV